MVNAPLRQVFPQRAQTFRSALPYPGSRKPVRHGIKLPHYGIRCSFRPIPPRTLSCAKIGISKPTPLLFPIAALFSMRAQRFPGTRFRGQLHASSPISITPSHRGECGLTIRGASGRADAAHSSCLQIVWQPIYRSGSIVQMHRAIPDRVTDYCDRNITAREKSPCPSVLPRWSPSSHARLAQ
jgi:hypothetical protein